MAQGLEAQFCNEVNIALRNRDANKLHSILVLEPPFQPIYVQLIASLREHFPAEAEQSEERLQHLVRSTVTETGDSEDEEGRPVQSWGPMVLFLAGWMAFIRDLNIENLLTTYEGLSELQQKANGALQHPTKGILVLPTLIGYAKVFARVAIGLDRRPELIQHLTAATVTDEGRRESLPEKAANVVRNGFITCLNDRNTAPGGIKDGKPDGKKVGVYKMANVCLKILFQADKLESCMTIFHNIMSYSPPIHYYPASERVTYLYYLGRFYFTSTDYFKAQLCLQKAYDDCAVGASCVKQRRIILIYLVTANLMLGRFPTQEIYSRPEANGLKRIFFPITEAIRKGDLESFRRITNLDLSHPSAAWLSDYRLFYQIGNYCEVLVWRSLFRRVFLLTGQQGTSEKSAPTLDLNDVLAAFLYFEKRSYMTPAMAKADSGPGRRHITFVLQDFTPRASYVDPDFDGTDLQPTLLLPDIDEIECICGSLISQGFLNGYISHKSKRFAIQGTRRAGSALKAGFPNVWEVVKQKNLENNKDKVLGWVTEAQSQSGGQVVRLAGARPAGS